MDNDNDNLTCGEMPDAGCMTEFHTSYYKSLAKKHLAGKYWEYIGISILLSVLSSGGGIIPPVILTGISMAGFAEINMAVIEGRNPTVKDAFCGFDSAGKTILTGLLISLYSFFWSLLIIPIFIKIFSYSATFYLLRKYPQLDADEAITKSCELMDGHKWEAFLLLLSFLGWMLLVLITFGLAGLYVGSYMSVTFAEFYNKLIEDDAAKNNAQ